jgi:hypothetical protein
VGKVREPGIVLLLNLVTFGIYGLYWWWTISRETDGHLRRRHAHPLMRIGILLAAAGLVGYLLGFLLFFGAVLGSQSSGGSGGGLAAAGFGGLLLLFLAFGALAAGAICTLVAAWRIWSVLRDREQALGARKPLSPGWQLALMLIPYVNIVGGFVVLYRTQSHLNAMWQNRLLE